MNLSYYVMNTLFNRESLGNSSGGFVSLNFGWLFRLLVLGCMPPPVSSAVILTKAVSGNEVKRVVVHKREKFQTNWSLNLLCHLSDNWNWNKVNLYKDLRVKINKYMQLLMATLVKILKSTVQYRKVIVMFYREPPHISILGCSNI